MNNALKWRAVTFWGAAVDHPKETASTLLTGTKQEVFDSVLQMSVENDASEREVRKLKRWFSSKEPNATIIYLSCGMWVAIAW